MMKSPMSNVQSPKCLAENPAALPTLDLGPWTLD